MSARRGAYRHVPRPLAARQRDAARSSAIRTALRWVGKGGEALRRIVACNVDAFADDLVPVLDATRAEGRTSLRTVAAELIARGIRTRRGGHWHVSTGTEPAPSAFSGPDDCVDLVNSQLRH